MRRLYLVRHGETEANRLKIIQSQNNGDYLNFNGVAQARHLGKALVDVKFQFIYTSPARRAIDTAKIIAFHNKNDWDEIFVGNTPIVEDGLLEVDHGAFEGRRADEMATQYPKLYNLYHTKPLQFAFPQGESITKAKSRVGQVIDRILDNRLFTENVLVVSHGGAIALAIINIFDFNIDKKYHSIFHHNCALSIIESSPDTETRIERLNDINHLKEL